MTLIRRLTVFGNVRALVSVVTAVQKWFAPASVALGHLSRFTPDSLRAPDGTHRLTVQFSSTHQTHACIDVRHGVSRYLTLLR